MLFQELPRIESSPLDGLERWLVPALVAGAAITVAALLALFGAPLLGGAAALVGIGSAVFALVRAPRARGPEEPLIVGPDYALLGSALGMCPDPVALTTGAGSLLVVNAAYRERFGARPPIDLATGEEAAQGLKLAQTMALRDGAGCVAGIVTESGASPVEVERSGTLGDLLLWRFPAPPPSDPLAVAVRRMEGVTGERLSAAGVMAAVVDHKGEILAANAAFSERALDPAQPRTPRFNELVEVGEDDQMRLVAEGEGGEPVRAVHVPADASGEGGAGTFLLFDSAGAASVAQSSNLQTLLDILPIGLALVDRDGRFLTMNQAFRQAAGL
jgi:two-component system cell cycle sensor histidine kinase/response regulator CckA